METSVIYSFHRRFVFRTRIFQAISKDSRSTTIARHMKRSFVEDIAKRCPRTSPVQTVLWSDGEDRYTCSWEEFQTVAKDLPNQRYTALDPWSSLVFVGEGGKWWLHWRCCDDIYYSDWVLCRTPNTNKPHRAPTAKQIEAELPSSVL